MLKKQECNCLKNNKAILSTVNFRTDLYAKLNLTELAIKIAIIYKNILSIIKNISGHYCLALETMCVPDVYMPTFRMC